MIAAALFTVPFLGITIAALGYLALIPYTIYRYRWLSRHPEAWDVPVRQRRAVARAARSTRRLGLRPPLRRRVAGRAGAMARGVRRRLGPDDAPPGSTNGRTRAPGQMPQQGQISPRGSRRRLNLRRR